MSNRYGFKIRVHNPKESKEIQKLVRKFGFHWSNPPTKQNLSEPYLFFDIQDKYITYMAVGREEYFQRHSFIEITLEELKERNFKKKFTKLKILCSLQDDKSN